MSKVKVTVVKKIRTEDVFGKNMPKLPRTHKSPCDMPFEEGESFIFEAGKPIPEGFCSWAYADLQRDITHLMFGGDYPWVIEKGVNYAACTDGLRPVIFKLERIE